MSVLVAIGTIAAVAVFLRQAVIDNNVMGAGRRKKRGFLQQGLEEFEDKVDKIANGQDDESWIGQLYNQFSTNLGIDGGKIDDADIGSMDGLEPPAVDES